MSLPPQGPQRGYPPAPLQGTRDPRRAGEASGSRPPYPPGQAPIPPRRPRRSSPIVAPVLAFLALVLVAGASVALVNFVSSTIDSASPSETAPPAIAEAHGTPAAAVSGDPVATSEAVPTDGAEVVASEEPEGTAEAIVVVPPSDQRQDVTGSILFSRLGGDIWVASGTTLTNLTNSSSTKADSTPVWSPDGKYVYFIRSTKREVKEGLAQQKGKYTFYPTDVMRMKADGSDRKTIFSSLIKGGQGLWFSYVLQPSVSPSGRYLAVVSDGPKGDDHEVVLYILDTRTGRLQHVSTPAEPFYAGTSGLGHNDPAFSPDGTKIAFTYNQTSGSTADPKIAIFTCRTRNDCARGKTRYLKAGYANPSWSPDGKLLAVEATNGTGRDIVLISSTKGDERLRLTQDGNSFAPEFSPAGDQIAYLHRDGQDIDVRVMSLDIDARGNVTLSDDRPVTSDGQVDGQSGVSWFIPASALRADQRAATGQGGSSDSGTTNDGAVESPAADDQSSSDGSGGNAPPPPPGG
jgi:Tol biopolymer transport system component